VVHVPPTQLSPIGQRGAQTSVTGSHAAEQPPPHVTSLAMQAPSAVSQVSQAPSSKWQSPGDVQGWRQSPAMHVVPAGQTPHPASLPGVSIGPPPASVGGS
jgi:hypothetical protein